MLSNSKQRISVASAERIRLKVLADLRRDNLKRKLIHAGVIVGIAILLGCGLFACAGCGSDILMRGQVEQEEKKKSEGEKAAETGRPLPAPESVATPSLQGKGAGGLGAVDVAEQLRRTESERLSEAEAAELRKVFPR